MFGIFRNFSKCLEFLELKIFQTNVWNFLRAERAGRHLKMKPADCEGSRRATLFSVKNCPVGLSRRKNGCILKCWDRSNFRKKDFSDFQRFQCSWSLGADEERDRRAEGRGQDRRQGCAWRLGAACGEANPRRARDPGREGGLRGMQRSLRKFTSSRFGVW